jgi:hypothetical protein
MAATGVDHGDRATFERTLPAIAAVYGAGPKGAERVVPDTVERPPCHSGEPMAPAGSGAGPGT